jgi:hypothetical protein
MAYSLKTPEQIVVDLPGEASITARPVTTPVLEEAKAVAARKAREARADATVMAQIGLSHDGDGKDEDIGDAIYLFFLRIELGIRLIISWQGFGDEAEAEPTLENIKTVFCLFPTVGRLFYEAVMIRPMIQAAVKKNSASAAPGTSSPAAAGDTATAAGN